jgi:hypothetical protein
MHPEPLMEDTRAPAKGSKCTRYHYIARSILLVLANHDKCQFIPTFSSVFTPNCHFAFPKSSGNSNKVLFCASQISEHVNLMSFCAL